MKRIICFGIIICCLLSLVGCNGQKDSFKVKFYNIDYQIYLEKDVEEGHYVIDEIAPEVDGYRFEGWLLEEKLVKEFDVNTDVDLFPLYVDTTKTDLSDYHILMDQTELVMNVGQTIQLNWTIQPEGYDGKVFLHSADEEIVKVNEDGSITAVKAGETLVNIALYNSGLDILIQVNDPNNPIIHQADERFDLVSKEFVTLAIGETSQIVMDIYSSNPDVKTVIYTSDLPAIASVTPTGLVKALDFGTGYIRVSSKNGDYERLVFIYVDGLRMEAYNPNPNHKYTVNEMMSIGLDYKFYKNGEVIQGTLDSSKLKAVIEKGADLVEVKGSNIVVKKNTNGEIVMHYEYEGAKSNSLTIPIAQK